MMRTQLHCTLGSTCYPKRGEDPGRSYRLRVTQLTRHCCSTLQKRMIVVVAVQRSDRGSSPRTASRVPGAGQGPPEDPMLEKRPTPGVPPGRTDPPPSAQAKHAPSRCEPRSRATARRAAH